MGFDAKKKSAKTRGSPCADGSHPTGHPPTCSSGTPACADGSKPSPPPADGNKPARPSADGDKRSRQPANGGSQFRSSDAQGKSRETSRSSLTSLAPLCLLTMALVAQTF